MKMKKNKVEMPDIMALFLTVPIFLIVIAPQKIIKSVTMKYDEAKANKDKATLKSILFSIIFS